LWNAALLPAGNQSWSYNLVAGADFSASNVLNVAPLASLAPDSGSLLLGSGAPALPTATATGRTPIIPKFYQTIRTGTGSINIAVGNDVEILNTLATIYTAGTQAPVMANFTAPNLTYGSTGALGTAQSPFYPALYSLNGGSVNISAQNNIGHYLNDGGTLIPDSSAEMPTNWLYRRGFVDPATGLFGASSSPSHEIASTSWWIDFSNFFEGVGALGGGNVTLKAGNDIDNVDALVPTNARRQSHRHGGQQH
jgi:filamentous hemagglutinin